ncbi:amidophosphoribosyltransferase-like isoform X2 [Tachypleus tridentatus]|uniref:amidophosphoribosyltransferase-like isoform X2 n=1 Tax=Tachypleus tridentatus TaxID=6853 RepID=UPI003FD2A079
MEELNCLQEACGLFACVACGEWPTNLDVAHIIYLGLVALQHRGQEMAGIVTSKGENKKKFAVHRGVGNVSQVFSEDHLRNLHGNLGIGHTRYSTHGGTEHQNAQPFVVYTLHGLLAVAHNGELVNAKNIRNKILENGVGLSTGSDSELITQILSMPPPEESNHGDFKPEGWIVSSETCVFPSVSAKLHREIEPGEIVQVTKHGIQSIGIVSRPDNKLPAFCIFEYVYFARPDSILEGQMVYMVRKECGRQLALEAAYEADIVSTIPESATPSALGFSEASGIPYAEVLCKNRYVGRTFIQPNPRLRQLAVAKKFGPLSANFRGKIIILIDDSIVRGTTIGAIIKLLKESGAKEVHIRIASPPLHYPCYMGINIPTREELIANELNAEQLAKKLGANSLVYLSVDGLLSAVQRGISNNGKPFGHCTACLTGKYPVELEW